MAKHKSKNVGSIGKKFIKKYNLKIANEKIVQSLGLVHHTQKHLENFCSVDSFNRTLIDIPKILSKPYYVSYDNDKNSLKYYGKIVEYVCIVVNITDTENFVSTFYPVAKAKIDKKRFEDNKW